MMEARHLANPVKRLVAAARALEQAVKADDAMLIAEAHSAVGRQRERLGPQIALVVQAAQSAQRARAEREAQAEAKAKGKATAK